MLWSLLSFGMEMIAARFQRWDIVLVLRARLYIFVRYLMASRPRCLKCLMFMPSGPAELLFVLFEVAICTCVMISTIFLGGKCLDCMVYVFVDFDYAIWGDVVNCLLKAFALFKSVMAVYLVPK